jgi:hypothetical protein
MVFLILVLRVTCHYFIAFIIIEHLKLAGHSLPYDLINDQGPFTIQMKDRKTLTPPSIMIKYRTG